jgi:hypothetical protein
METHKRLLFAHLHLLLLLYSVGNKMNAKFVLEEKIHLKKSFVDIIQLVQRHVVMILNTVEKSLVVAFNIQTADHVPLITNVNGRKATVYAFPFTVKIMSTKISCTRASVPAQKETMRMTNILKTGRSLYP